MILRRSALGLPGCGDSSRDSVVMSVKSPAGWAEAQIVEDEDLNTQVRVVFEGGRCTGDSTRSPGIGLGLRLRWVDDTTLQVTYPPGVMLDRPSDVTLRCEKREVRTVLAKQ